MTRHFFARMAAAVMIVAAGLLGTVATAQNRAISGTVVDESGAPVIGAAVVVVGNSSIGAVTDMNGAFRLNVPAGANINVSCIGYADQTVAVGNQTTFRFVLAENTEFLDETVVIGYGVQKKSDLTPSRARPPVFRSSTTLVLRVPVRRSAFAVIPPTPATSDRSSLWTA